MPLLGAHSWEYFGQPEFPWWAVICCAAGAGLMLFGGMLRRERIASAAEGGHNVPLHRPPPAEYFGLPLSVAAFVAGLVIFSISLAWAGIAALKNAPHEKGFAGMLWTLAVLLATFWLFYLRVNRYLSKGRMITLMTLRAAAVALLVVELFQPAFVVTSDAAGKSKLAVVIDASGSMATVDEANTPSRYRQSVLAAENTVQALLADHYELSFYAYDGKHAEALKSAREYGGVSPDGTVTDLSAAAGLGGAGGASHIILFSDGIHNGPAPVTAGLDRFRIPVSPVLVGSTTNEASNVPNITVAGVDAPLTATVNNEVVVSARIKSVALASRTVRVQLFQIEASGAKKILEEQRLILQKGGGPPQKVDFKYVPSAVGRTSLEVRVPADPDERNTGDNAAATSILVTDTKLPVLYVEGRVRPEVGKLMRALSLDPNVSAVSLVQVQAGTFTISGLKPGDDLKGLPQTLAQWKRFKVIIIGDLDASFLSPAQQNDLEQAVKDGAGLLMIGGRRSFAAGGWGATKLAGMLPVDLAKVEPAQVNTPFVPQLTAVGTASPITRNIAEFFGTPGGGPAAKQLPQLLGCVAIAGAKPGAEVLMVHPTEKINGKPAVVLAVQEYPKGRTAAFAADTTIQWTTAMAAAGKDSPYNRFWGQMVRWLAGQEDLAKKNGPSVTAMLARDRYEINEQVPLKSALTDKAGQSTQYAEAWAEVTSPDGKTARVPMSASKEQPGIYDGAYTPALAGTYKIRFGGRKDGLDLGRDDTAFSINQAAAESERTAADAATMEEIARVTRGHAPVGLDGVAKLCDALNAEIPKENAGTRRSFGLWNPQLEWPTKLALGHLLAALFFVAVALEWFFRRKWQLQ